MARFLLVWSFFGFLILKITSAHVVHRTGNHLRQKIRAMKQVFCMLSSSNPLMATGPKPKVGSVATKTSPNLLSPASVLTASVHEHLCEDDCSSNVPGYLLIYNLIQGDFGQRDIYVMEDLHVGPWVRWKAVGKCRAEENAKPLHWSARQYGTWPWLPAESDFSPLSSSLVPFQPDWPPYFPPTQ